MNHIEDCKNLPGSFMRLMILLLICCLFSMASPVFSETLEFSRCQVAKGGILADAECAVLSRPENPADANGSTIDIHIVKFMARTPEPAADALTLIQGGPGMSSIDLALSMRGVLGGVLAKRDIIVVDQRGTGRSNMLTCPMDSELGYAEFDPAVTRKLASDCLSQLGSDPRFYTTSVAVEDLEAVRQAAGYEQLSIYGVSYGTRVAQHYLRRYPDRTRVLILDGVADVGLNLAGGEIARRSQQAFDRIVARCNSDRDCAARFGDLAKTFQHLRSRLRDEPQQIRFAHPVSGEFVEQTLTEQHLLALLRLMPYATESLSLLPLILHAASTGNFIPMAAQAVLIDEQFTQDYAYAMNNSVVCTEDAPFLSEQDLQGQSDTYFGDDLSQGMQALCEVWPRGLMHDDFREPFESEVPVLLLSGENDPITPPENAERALQMFSNGLHISVPAHGHGVIGRGCLPQLASEFIEAASTAETNPQCAERERALPFFVSPAGPTP